MNYREYRYVGSSAISEALPQQSGRVHVQSAQDVLAWISATDQVPETNGGFVATFIVDPRQQLWINDRRSEHVLCAAGGNVLSAGEITFTPSSHGVDVSEVTNQSTGYCPEPESWDVVEQALDQAAIAHPGEFTTAFTFRLCSSCGATNIVKDDWFVCTVCDTALPTVWNFGYATPEG